MAKLTTQPAIDLVKLSEAFDTDVECRAYLENLRWPNGVKCVRCSSDSISRIKERKVFECNACRYQFSVTAGTIFHDSHLPLPKWFLAIFLISESKKGMSALQLKRLLKVSYKTAWYLCHRIREAMKSGNDLLTGTVEVDETFVGGKRRGVGRGKRDDKVMVMGAVQRDGKLRMAHTAKGVKNTKPVLHQFVRENIAGNASRILTDGLPSYKGIADHDTEHHTVDHSHFEWVRGDIHTNQIEGAFGLFKRALVGSFHQVSVKHLDRYLDEFTYRYDNRKNPYLFRDVLVKLTDGKALPYDKLTA